MNCQYCGSRMGTGGCMNAFCPSKIGKQPSVLEPTQLDRIEAKLDQLLERKKPKKTLLTEWIPPAYVDQKIWDAFIKHRKEKKQALKEESYKWCLREMDKINKAGHDVNKAIIKSIANGYTGIFAPLEPKNGQPEIFSQSHQDADFSGKAEAELDDYDPYAELKERM